jgi:hypothetical protein
MEIKAVSDHFQNSLWSQYISSNCAKFHVFSVVNYNTQLSMGRNHAHDSRPFYTMLIVFGTFHVTICFIWLVPVITHRTKFLHTPVNGFRLNPQESFVVICILGLYPIVVLNPCVFSERSLGCYFTKLRSNITPSWST